MTTPRVEEIDDSNAPAAVPADTKAKADTDKQQGPPVATVALTLDELKICVEAIGATSWSTKDPYARVAMALHERLAKGEQQLADFIAEEQAKSRKKK